MTNVSCGNDARSAVLLPHRAALRRYAGADRLCQNRDSRFLFQMQHQILPVQFVSVRGKLVPKFNNR